jgi:hypothetical protein
LSVGAWTSAIALLGAHFRQGYRAVRLLQDSAARRYGVGAARQDAPDA